MGEWAGGVIEELCGTEKGNAKRITTRWRPRYRALDEDDDEDDEAPSDRSVAVFVDELELDEGD